MNKEKMIALFSEFIEKHFGGSVENNAEPLPKEPLPEIEIRKSVDEEKRLALFVVLEPQEGDLTSDLHADTYTAEEIEKACHNFNQFCDTAYLFHAVETENASIVESYISPADFHLDGELVKKGTWLQMWHFPQGTGDELWEGVKSGDINGVSIGALASVESIDD